MLSKHCVVSMGDLLGRVKPRRCRWSRWNRTVAPAEVEQLLRNQNARYVRVEYANYTYEWKRADV